MKALILVDIQNDFFPGGELAVPEGDRVIAVANRVMRKFELVVATQDWHPANHQSFAANHAGKKIGDVVEVSGLRQILWPVHCVQESGGAALAGGLRVDRIDRVFRKGTDPQIDSYSGLFDNGHRKSTGLAEFLRERGVSEVNVMGLATDYCVKFTALDAAAEGFKVWLIEDGCRGVNISAGDSERAVEAMRSAGARIVRSGEV